MYRQPLNTFIFFVILLSATTCHSQTTSRWINADGGLWFRTAHWDNGLPPNNIETQKFNAVIDLETSHAYEIETDRLVEVENLTIDSENATLHVLDHLTANGVLNLVNGTLKMKVNSTIDAGEIHLNGNSIEFDRRANIANARIIGDLLVDNGVRLTLTNANLNDSLRLREDATLQVFGESMTLENDVSIQQSTFDSRTHLTVGESSLVFGYGKIFASSLDNKGRITSNWRNRSLTISQLGTANGDFVNQGLMRATDGGRIHLAGSGAFRNSVDGKVLVEADSSIILDRDWSNEGVIDVRKDATLEIRGDFATSDLKNVVARVGSSILVSDVTWDNEGQSYTFGNRLDRFRFGRTTINGGNINFSDGPINTFGLTLNDTFVRGDIRLNDAGNNIHFNDGRLFGDIELNEDVTVQTRFTNLQSVGKISLNHQDATIYIGKQDEDIRWNAGQTIEGLGFAGFGYSGQSLRNFGTIRANVDDGWLYIWSAREADEVLINHGLFEADNGSVLHISAGDGLFFNHDDGIIRAKNSSVVNIWAANFKNNGLFEVLDDSAVELGGNYDAQYVNGFVDRFNIMMSESARIGLDGTMNLAEGETFAPVSNAYFTNRSQVYGGTVDVSNLDQGNQVVGRFRNVDIIGNVFVPESTTLNLEGQSSISGNALIDGGVLNTFGSSLDGDVAIRNGGTGNFSGSDTFAGDFIVDKTSIANGSGNIFNGRVILDGGQLTVTSEAKFNRSVEVHESGKLRTGRDASFNGDIVVDGPESLLETDAVFESVGSTITLRNGGTLRAINIGALQIGSGVRLTGSGTVDREDDSYFSRLDNRGLVDVQGSDVLEIADGIRNGGSIIVSNGGSIELSGRYGLEQSTSGASVILDNGHVKIDQASFAIFDGEVKGNGTIESSYNFFRGGTLSPGLEVGTLSLIGDTQFNRVADIVFDVAGIEAGVIDGHDILLIDGDLELGSFSDDAGGNLSVNTFEDVSIGDLLGAELSIIELAEGFAISGEFENVSNGSLLSSIDERFQFNVFYGAESTYGANRVVLTNFSLLGGSGLTAIPEPSTAFLFTFIAMMFSSRRKRNNAPIPN